MKKNNIINYILVLLMVLKCFPLTILAIEETNKTYIYDDYTIEYNIANSWENNQNIEIIITNTSEKTIENWMLSYDFCGEVQDIWNAEIKTTTDGIKYVKNAGHNCTIKPDCSVKFGYTLAEAEDFPSEFSMCQEKVSKAEGYEVTLNVINTWEDNNFQGEIVIINNTDKAIECWELDIDSNFTIAEITNSWAATVSSYGEGRYTLKGTYTNIIYPNSSITLGFLGVKNGKPEMLNYSLSEVVVGEVSKSEENNDDAIVSVEEMYYKDIQSDDEVDYDGNGIYFVRNQLLITAHQGISFEEVEALVKEMDAKIVGYIGITNDYQIEFNSDVSTEYLYQQIDNLMNNQLIEDASFNTAIKITKNSIPLEYEKNWQGIEGENWHLEAIKIKEAIKNFYDKTSNIKIGVIDGVFYNKHKDLQFEKLWRNPVEEAMYYGYYSDKYYSDTTEIPLKNAVYADNNCSHGSHVAGIIASEWNNMGIAGICPNVDLYGYSLLGELMTSSFTTIMSHKIAFATLIINDVRVINISLGETTTEICLGASTERNYANNDGTERAINYLETNSQILGGFLYRLIQLEYDFLIVTAAGNINDIPYYVDEASEYGITMSDKAGSLLGVEAGCNSYWNYIGYRNNSEECTAVKNRIIVVGSIKEENKQYKYSSFSNCGDRVDIVAPGERILSVVNGTPSEHSKYYDDSVLKLYRDDGYPYKMEDGTSMAAPQVAGVAGMMYSVNPSLTAEQVKQIIVETATEKVSGYGLLNAYAAVNKAYFTPSVGGEEIYDGLLMGKILKPNGSEFENVTINVYEYKDINANIPPNDMIKPTKGEEVLYTTTSNEFGDYVLRLGNNCRYWIEYVYEGYKTEKFITYINSRQLIVQDVTMKRTNTLETVISNAKEESQMGAYVDVVSTIQNDSLEGEYITKYDDGSYTFMITSPDTESISGSSDENGVFSAMLDDGTYEISVNKEGYIPTTIQVEAKDEKVYDKNGEILEKITLIPMGASIYGTVTIRNITTNEVKPKAGHAIRILKDGAEYTTVTTQADGKYNVKLNEYGNYTVVCDAEKQSEFCIDTNMDCEASFELEYKEDKEEDEEDTDDWTEVGEEDKINIEFTGDGDSSFTGDESGNLNDGVWLKIFDNTDSYYVKIYTTSDSGEYNSTFGSPGWGLHTTLYNYWTGQLKMATYRSDGSLVKDQVIEYLHKKTHIFLPKSDPTDTTPLMRIDAITSLSIDNTGVTYTIHTDGYYKTTYNIIGSLGVKKENWTDDQTKTITLYKGGSPAETSKVSPFDN